MRIRDESARPATTLSIGAPRDSALSAAGNPPGFGTCSESASTTTRLSLRTLAWIFSPHRPFALIAAIVLPILLFAVAVSVLLDRHHRSAIERELDLAARSASAALNLKLAGELATIETIVAAMDIAEVIDSEGLREARRVVDAEPDWLGLRLIDAGSGQTVVHLGHGLGREPSTSPGRTVGTSDTRIGGLRRPEAEDVSPYVPLQVPVLRDGSVSYLLIAFVRAAAFGELLNKQAFASDWTAGVLDGEHQLIGYSRAASDLDDAIGERASLSVVERIRQNPNTVVFFGRLLDRPMYFAVRHSRLSGWTTFVGAPAEVVEAPLRRHRALMLGAGVVAVLLTLSLAGTLLRSAARLREERALVRQKDLLLREINHRIKNNLQVIASLVNLQADRAPLPQTRRELETIGSRVRALSLVHEQLHPKLAEGAIDLAVYLEELCGYLMAVHGWAARDVRLACQLQPIAVKADAAVPIGLIVNEVLTNSLKHAFPHGRGGTVQVVLENDGPSRARLELTDDGVGLQPGLTREEGVGLSLIEMLVNQTGGELSWSLNEGTTLRLGFPL